MNFKRQSQNITLKWSILKTSNSSFPARRIIQSTPQSGTIKVIKLIADAPKKTSKLLLLFRLISKLGVYKRKEAKKIYMQEKHKH